MQNILPGTLLASSCPFCRTLLVSGKTIIGGVIQCSKCKNYWLVDMDANTYELTIKLSLPACKASDRL